MDPNLSQLAEEFQNYLEFKKGAGKPSLENVWAIVKKLSIQLDTIETLLRERPNIQVKKEALIARQQEIAKRMAEGPAPAPVPPVVPFTIKEPYPSKVIRLGHKPRLKEKNGPDSLSKDQLYRVGLFSAMNPRDIPIADEPLIELMQTVVKETMLQYNTSKMVVMKAYAAHVLDYTGHTNFYNWLQGYDSGRMSHEKIARLKTFLTRAIVRATNADQITPEDV